MMRQLIIALVVLSESLIVNGQIEYSLIYKARAAEEQFDYVSAVNYYSVFLDSFPGENMILKSKSEALYLIDEIESAIHGFSRINNQKPALTALWLAKCYARLENEDSMIYFMREHLESKYRINPARIKMSPEFLPFENSKKWLEVWKSDWYTSTEMRLFDLDYAIENQNYEEAFELINEIIEKRPSNHKAYLMRGKIYFLTKDYKSAAEDFQAAANLRKRHSDCHEWLGKALLKEGKGKKAALSYTNAMELEDIPPLKWFYYRGCAFALAEEFDNGINDLNFYLRYKPNDEKALYELARCYKGSDDLIPAIENINTAISLSPDNIDFRLLRAELYFETNTFKFAERDLSMILDYDPKNMQAIFLRGKARIKQGDYDAACHDFNKARVKVPAAEDWIRKYCMD